MARIAFAWELGAELGHAMSCSAVARLLHARGHRIAFMFRELHQLAFLSDTSPYDIFQAPVSVSEGRGAPIPVSYADILVGCGYDRPGQVTGLLGGWLALLGRWQPRPIVVTDFAPTALLAARMLGVKRVCYGNGFSIPPQLSPLPAFRYDEPVSPERVLEADARALAGANAALARFGGTPMRHLCEQFQTDEDFLATFPELDSYGNRPLSGYWGPRFNVESGASVHWPAGPGKRVIVYVKKNLPQFDALFAALAASPHRIAAFIPEIDKARRDALASPRRIVSDRPMRLAPLLEECDLFVSHGGQHLRRHAHVGSAPARASQPVRAIHHGATHRADRRGPLALQGVARADRGVPAAHSRRAALRRSGAGVRAPLSRLLARRAAAPHGDAHRADHRRAIPVARIAVPGAAPILSPTSTGQGAAG